MTSPASLRASCRARSVAVCSSLRSPGSAVSMATIYSTRFIRGTVDLDSLPSYTVPDGYVAVVRQITAYDGDNILDDYIQLVHSDGTILAAYNAPAGEAGTGRRSSASLLRTVRRSAGQCRARGMCTSAATCSRCSSPQVSLRRPHLQLDLDLPCLQGGQAHHGPPCAPRHR